MTLQKRLGALEAVVEARVEEEFMAFYAVLERHLSREEFLKVVRIAAHVDEQ